MKITLSSIHAIRWANNHMEALDKIFPLVDGYVAYERLRKFEKEASRKNTDYCNGDLSSEAHEAWEKKFLARLETKMGNLPEGFFINGDPRGYALKIKENFIPEGMHKDWGGYGILAPEF